MRTRRLRGTNQYKVKDDRYYGLTWKTWRSILAMIGVTTILVSIAMHAQASAKSDGIVSPIPTYLEGLDENGLPYLTPEQTSDWQAFIRAAHKLAPIYDYPVKVIISQGALESGRGTSKFAKERFNYFGYRCYDGREEEMCAYFDNMEQGILAYMSLIKENYPEAYAQRGNPEKMIELIKQGGYATDPDYVSKIKRLPEWRDNK